jgi:hypothetical protein
MSGVKREWAKGCILFESNKVGFGSEYDRAKSKIIDVIM